MYLLSTGRTLAALLMLVLALGCGPDGSKQAYVPPRGWEGRLVQTPSGALPLLDEPSGITVGRLAERTPVRVTARVVDESGRIWLKVVADSSAGWALQDMLRLADGEEGRIETH